MQKAKFVISVDSCSDMFRSYMEQNRVYCLIVKRILNGQIIEELFDSEKEYDNFYESIRKGALPTTSLPNPTEFYEHFMRAMDAEECDSIHIGLSSGLSNNVLNAVIAAEEINSTRKDGRKAFVVDSLAASLPIAMLTDKAIEMRDAGLTAAEATEKLNELRHRMQVWIMVDDLFHLKRSGRIGGFKAAIGSVLGIKPIIIFNDKGKLVIESTQKGARKSIDYLLSKVDELGIGKGHDLNGNLRIAHSSVSETAARVQEALTERFGPINVKTGLIGPIVGTHIGAGTVGVVFFGEKRLTVD